MCQQTPHRCLNYTVVIDSSVIGRLQSQKWPAVGEEPRAHSWSESFFQVEKVYVGWGHVLGVGVGGESLEEELRAVPGSSIYCNPLGMCGAPAPARLFYILSLSSKGKSPSPSLCYIPFP